MEGDDANAKECYLVVRTCSAYSLCDINIGIYDSEEGALAAKAQYIHTLGETGDKHEVQAYHQVDFHYNESMDVGVDTGNEYGVHPYHQTDLENDVNVVPVEVLTLPGDVNDKQIHRGIPEQVDLFKNK